MLILDKELDGTFIRKGNWAKRLELLRSEFHSFRGVMNSLFGMCFLTTIFDLFDDYPIYRI